MRAHRHGAPNAAEGVSALEHLVRQRGSHATDDAVYYGARHRLHGGVGCLEQHAKLLGQHWGRKTWLQAAAEQRGFRGGASEAAESPRPDCAAVPGGRFRLPGLHSARCAASPILRRMLVSSSNTAATRHDAPVVIELQVIPVAGHDSMLMNLSGAHGPYFTRNIVILKDSAGNTGGGEGPGGDKIRETL